VAVEKHHDQDDMTRTMLALMLLCLAGPSLADDARPSMPYYGTAEMDNDGNITLLLTTTADGKPVSTTLTYKVGDRGYDSVLRHLGGLDPGGTKPLRPWKD
jgi:hypothetical protein